MSAIVERGGSSRRSPRPTTGTRSSSASARIPAGAASSSRASRRGPETSSSTSPRGTAAVAIELARRYGCSVVGADQSPEMLAEGRARVDRRGPRRADPSGEGASRGAAVRGRQLRRAHLHLPPPVRRRPGRDAPRAGARRPAGRTPRLARFLRPGGRADACPLERLRGYRPPFPRGLVSTGWAEVGRFLGPSIRSFYAAYPLERILALWRDAGIADVRARPLSLGGGVVIWGVRGH